MNLSLSYTNNMSEISITLCCDLLGMLQKAEDLTAATFETFTCGQWIQENRKG